ncbi:odorant receptor 85f-like isoform X1 [Linepithema humile]|uniref:odorant receptor 85f-like isoform X1 n=1 Tax=Linepithema humile TaxID=83485 RepID=UPI00351E7D10
MTSGSMDFQSVNPLNVWLNIISGNLLPMSTDNSSFPVFLKIYSVLVWFLEVVQTCVLIPGCFLVPKEKALKDGLVALVVTIEVVFMVVRIYSRRSLVQELIRKFNDILRMEDEMMKKIVIATLKTTEIPIKFYWTAGVVSIVMWSGTPLALIFHRNFFFYVDYRMPVAFSKEPVTTTVFVIGSFIIMISSMYIFTKKVSVDSYMMHMILLITAQYKYIALKLSMIFKDGLLQSDRNSSNEKEYYLEKDNDAEEKIKNICRHHNTIVRITLMLSDLLSLNFSLIYVNSVLRVCGIAIMVFAIPSTTPLEGSLILMYASGGILQLYILCSCVQQLLDASVEITDQAFHEEWYRYRTSVKRKFMLMIMANNLDIKLSTFAKYNLSLPSFMTVSLNAYFVIKAFMILLIF